MFNQVASWKDWQAWQIQWPNSLAQSGHDLQMQWPTLLWMSHRMEMKTLLGPNWKLGGALGRPLGVAWVSRTFWWNSASKEPERYWEDTVSDISLADQANLAIFELGFSSQSYYQPSDSCCKKVGRPRVIVDAQLKKIYSHPPFRHDSWYGSCF